VDLARFGQMSRAQARAALGLTHGELVIGTMGRLVPVKNHASLIEATRLMRDQGLKPTVIIAGEGPLRSDLEAQARAAGLVGAVRFLGHHPDPDVVMAALDVYVLPSNSEGLPNTVLEAMATGLPVVATRVGGMDELIQDGVTGFLVPPREPDPLARALGLLLRDEALRRTTGKAARIRTESEFTLSGMIRRYEALYTSGVQELARRNGQGGGRAAASGPGT
jgi:glycosyltransferase involved in cell wall biosynthesis